MIKDIFFDNRRPNDPNYPTAKPPQSAFNPKTVNGKQVFCIVEKGEYIVNRDGDIMIATTGNDKYIGKDFLDLINVGCIRAKYIGNEDDALEYTNQMRKAQAGEIAKAKKYKQVGYKVRDNGQGVLL